MNRDQPWDEGSGEAPEQRSASSQGQIDQMVGEVVDTGPMAPLDSLGMLGFTVQRA